MYFSSSSLLHLSSLFLLPVDSFFLLQFQGFELGNVENYADCFLKVNKIVSDFPSIEPPTWILIGSEQEEELDGTWFYASDCVVTGEEGKRR